MPEIARPPLTMSAGNPNSPGQSPARGLAAEINPARVAAEFGDMAIDPGDRAPHLVGEHDQAAAGLLHRAEIGDHVMGAGGEKHLGRSDVFGGGARPPGTAMNKDEHRPPLAPGTVDVELF